MKGTGVCATAFRGCDAMPDINLICLEDRLTDVYEGYESICLLTAESKYVPASHVTVLLSRFNELFALILSEIQAVRRLSQTDSSFIF